MNDLNFSRNTIVCVQTPSCASKTKSVHIFDDTQLSFVFIFLTTLSCRLSIYFYISPDGIRTCVKNTIIWDRSLFFFTPRSTLKMLNFRNRRRFNSYTQHRYEWNDLSLQYPTKTKMTVFQQHKIVVLSIYFYILLEARKIRTFRSFIYFVLRYSTPP